MSIVPNGSIIQKIKHRMANRVDPEMAHYEPSHQDLHCLERVYVDLKELRAHFITPNLFSFFFFYSIVNINPSPAEPGYVLPLQIV